MKIHASGLLLSIVPAWAHHSFSADFDAKKPVRLEGIVAKVEWTNPHVAIYLDIENPGRAKIRWMVEAASPNALLRHGFTKNSVSVGIVVVIDGYRAKSGAFRASGLDLILPGGKKLLLHSDSGDSP